MKITEAINTFSKWVSPARLAKAKARYDAKALTQVGQTEILSDAEHGETAAADYLFNFLQKVIAKAFWTYYLGPDKSKHRARIENGADKDFASVAYSMLLGSGATSPFATFDASKFNAKANLLKQFGYYVYRYLQNEAFKMIRADKMSGMTGNIANKEDVQVAGYEDHFENDEQASTGDSFTDKTDIQLTLKAFLKQLKTIKQVYYDVFKAKLDGMDTEAVAVKLGISGQSVRNHLKAIKILYDDFIGE